MRKFMKHIKNTVEKYGFRAEIVEEIKIIDRDEQNRFVDKLIKNPSVVVYAKNTDGKEVRWFEYNSNENKFHGENTDTANIWLCDTRKDLSYKDLANMFNEIEADMYVLVDPEDLQEIHRE